MGDDEQDGAEERSLSDDSPWSDAATVGPIERSAHVALVAIGLVVGLLFLRETAFVSAPLAIAIFGAILVWPLHMRARRSLPAPLAFVVTGGAVVGLLVGAGSLIVSTVSDFVQELPIYTELVHTTDGELPAWMPDPADFADRALGTLGSAARSVLSSLAWAALTLTFLLMVIGESEAWAQRIRRALSARAPAMVESFAQVCAAFRSYMLLHSLVSLLTGVLTVTVCWAFGVRDPHVWGVLAFFLNYIPNVGSLVAVIPPSLIAALELSPQYGGAVLGVLGLLQFSVGNWFEPWLMGRTFQLSSLVALASVALWAWVWGVSGALIAVPLTIFLLALARQSPQWCWVAELLTDDGKDGDEDSGPEPSDAT